MCIECIDLGSEEVVIVEVFDCVEFGDLVVYYCGVVGFVLILVKWVVMFLYDCGFCFLM